MDNGGRAEGAPYPDRSLTLPSYHDLPGALRLVWHIRNSNNEDLQWAVHTGDRVSAQYAALYTAMDTVFSVYDTNDNLGDCTLVGLSIQRWATGPGYVGFHQADSVLRNVASTTTADLPPQIAWAVGWRTDSVGFAAARLQSRRNRTYIGPLSESNDDTGGGRMSDTRRDGMVGRITDLHTDLKAIATDTGWEDLDGLVVTSPINNLAGAANEVVAGRAYDTMRSRRQKTPEDVNIFAL